MSDEALKRGSAFWKAHTIRWSSAAASALRTRPSAWRFIKGTTAYADLSDADVVIEAVFENMEIKKKIFAELDKVAKPGCVLATNTSTLDVEEIGKATKRPQDVIGLHFSRRPTSCPCFEIVRTPQTSPETIKTSVELAHAHSRRRRCSSRSATASSATA